MFSFVKCRLTIIQKLLKFYIDHSEEERVSFKMCFAKLTNYVK